jgi:hypothetical protein
MKTIRVGKTAGRDFRSSLRNVTHYLLVDVIPVIFLLAAMAYGMAFVSHRLTEPRSVELPVTVEKLS